MSQTAISQSPKTIRLSNIRNQQQLILQKVTQLAQNSAAEPRESQKLLHVLSQTITQVEQVCTQQQLSPASLTASSRQIYAWMKFLLDEHHLRAHLQATQQVQQLVAEVLVANSVAPVRKPISTDSKKIGIELLNMARLYRYKSNTSGTLLQIHEGFIAADDQVLTAVVQVALLGKSPATSQIIRTFSLSEEFSEVLLEMELVVECITETPQGQAHDLNDIFAVVNRKYFASQMPQPRLTWNQVLTRRKFGHYDPARDRVVISRTLDNRKVPQYVVEFIMYHELLHKQYGHQWGKSQLLVHTPEFRQDERKFKQYEQASAMVGKTSKNSLTLKTRISVQIELELGTVFLRQAK